jgi:AraC-like DNA-binding protein
MAAFELDVGSVSERQRFAAWSDAIVQAFGPFEIRRGAGTEFGGHLRIDGRGSIRIVDFRYSGHGFQRRRSDVNRLHEEYFTLARPVSGALHLEQGGVERVLEPGHLYLLNHSIPYRTIPRGDWRTVSVAFPPSALRRRAPSLEPFYDVPLTDAAPHGHLLTAFVDYFAKGLARWDEVEFAELADRLMDLVALLVLRPNRPLPLDEGGARTAYRERALRHIRANLADPDLKPASIARACGISLSYLHQAFRAAELGVEECIFAERLDRCREMLADPRHDRQSITTIAYGMGFSHPSHFSRSFKKRFGVSPSEVRRHERGCVPRDGR